MKAETDVEIPAAPSGSVAKKSDKKSKQTEKEKLKEVINYLGLGQKFYKKEKRQKLHDL